MTYMRKISRPATRRLRVFAFDPSLKQSLETVMVNSVTLEIPWEDHPFEEDKDGPAIGPIGEYLEVIDYDPSTGYFYEPVNLNDPYLLSQDGLTPSDGDPQFHQQMVYAVAMKTIKTFERALGRSILWAPRLVKENGNFTSYPVKRLRIYPHALREANAFYSPDHKAILFGYFNASDDVKGTHLPGGIVFTCLSHDIIVHELTHALVDGLHPRFNDVSNPDMLAFHEAFSDIVALFQHFSYSEVVKHQVAKTKGDIAISSLLGELALEFGRAIGQRGALRSAIGTPPDPSRLSKTNECHERGAILLAAVFDAFLSIYSRRTEDLQRIAQVGSSAFKNDTLHPDLVDRLAQEASKAADHVLGMCIRALDYLPPVDINFGDFLRAIITADYDIVPNDSLGYRVAMIEAFRRRGIYPENVRSLSEDSLLWKEPEIDSSVPDGELGEFTFVTKIQEGVKGWDLFTDRDELYWKMVKLRSTTHGMIKNSQKFKLLKRIGLDTSVDSVFQVHSIRPVRRVGPAGQLLMDLLVEITQWIPGYKDGVFKAKNGEKYDFQFRGGCTLLIDMKTSRIRYVIYKDINDENRYMRQQAYFNDSQNSDAFHSKFRSMLNETRKNKVGWGDHEDLEANSGKMEE